ncbi:MAG: CNNM domain-containing protein [Bacteroidales bacterium]
MQLLFIFLFIALAFSFLCSLLESVLLSITPSYVTMLKHEGKRYGVILAGFKDKIDRPLAAILTLNTFAHTLGAAGVGAQAQKLWGDTYLSLTSAVLTLLILVFSEIIPKTLGANYWKSLLKFTAYALLILIYSPLYPIILLSQFITRVFRKADATEDEIREEVLAMARHGAEKGALKKNESLIVQNLMRFQFVRARDIMTPRVMMKSIDEKTRVKEFYENIATVGFSRLPVYKGSAENVTGYLLKEDVMAQMILNAYDKPIAEFKREILVFPESTPVFKLYEKMMSSREMISLIVDEYGSTAGLVTMEDIIETILGLEIVDETDDIEDLQKYASERLKRRIRE